MRNILDCRIALAALAALHAPCAVSGAQEVERKPATGWEFVGLPALNYTSDEGFGYGVLAEIYNYGTGFQPYQYTIQPTVFLTTKGRRDVVLFFDAPHVLPNGWRLDASAAREQQLATPYYGVGNATAYDSTLERAPNPYYYRYEKVQTRLYVNAQHRIASAPARFLFGFGLGSAKTDATPFDSGTTLLATELGAAAAPRGRLGFVRAGLVWDTRDREIGPNTGTWAEMVVLRSDGMFGASHDFTRISMVVRHYVPIRSNLVAAFRVQAQQASGDVPLYELNTLQSSFKTQEALGGDKSVRGVSRNRFAGKGVALGNAELRWRFKEFALRGKPVFLLASGFLDAGRVWANSIQADELVKDLHAGYGGGLRVGLGPSFVVAVDYGRSTESSQIYIGLGYLF